MATIIRIKRSGTTGSPTTLKLGELAYTYLGGTQSNGGDRLYVGTGGVDSNGDALTLDVIGGKYFTDKLDHVPGTLTASSAIITDASNKIDVLNVDNITIDGNAITSTNTNGNITITPDGTGEIIASTLTVSDLTDNRIVLAGASGALEDDTNLTFDGTDFIINTTSSLQIPAGSTGDRPTPVTGQIRFNTTLAAFEGYHGTSWNSLGGIIDVDQDTKITAENAAGADSDALKFFTGGVLRMTLDSAELSLDGINLISSKSGDTLTIDPNPVGDSGTLVILGNLKVEGTQTIVNSTAVSINDKNLVLADSAVDSADANNAGFTINGPANPVTFLYKSASDTIQVNRPFTTPGSGVTNILDNYTTGDLTEGSNLYYTDERVDDRLSNLLLAGEAIDLTYDDSANTLQIDVELATVSNPGAASFDSDQMTVTSGFVTIFELDGGVY